VVEEERAPLTREAIVTTTRRLIVASGLGAVSLRGVAAELGVTAPALYAYVEDKRDLLRAVAEVEMAALLARFEGVEESDPAERVRRYSHAYLAHARENPELYEVMLLFPPEFGGGAANGDELAVTTKAFMLPAAAVTEAIEQGAFRALDPLQAALVMWTAMHGAASVLRMGLGFDETTEEALVETLIDTVMRGLRA
jgi:AcrR family transcriptional regulator